MPDELENLLARARREPITPELHEAQRRSFAYGNTKCSNDRITREMIDEAAEAINADH